MEVFTRSYFALEFFPWRYFSGGLFLEVFFKRFCSGGLFLEVFSGLVFMQVVVSVAVLEAFPEMIRSGCVSLWCGMFLFHA